MNNDLLLELGTEEIPARFISSTKKSMKTFLEKKLSELRISFDSIEIKCTPRRFAIFIKNLANTQQASTEEIKGPAKKIAFDENGNPSKALQGFLKSKNVTIDDIKIVQKGKEEYVFVVKTLETSDTVNYLKEIFEQMIDSLSFPKPMRWGGNKIKFIRPIRWILCLYQGKVPNFEMFSLNAANLTRGHRFLGESYIEINSIDEYEEKLEQNYVILDDTKRRELIRKQIVEVAEKLGGEYMQDEDLLEEVNYIVEYPTALYGEFKEEYLKLPKETIITPMKEHQRYFPVLDKNGNLMNKFITVRNGNDYMIENVKKGNEKVLDARLSDAKFFYEQDTAKKLESYVPRLQTIVYHEKLGTMHDKMLRIQKLSEEFAYILNVDNNDTSRAALLCKADLTTSMVFEFTELQGIMGRYYAKVSGENENVANAIYEHYLPRFAGDELPQSKVGILLSLADKLDSIAGFFSVGIKPTGSQDPYALRRLALGVLNTLIDSKIDTRLQLFVEIALKQFEDKHKFDFNEVYNEILEFMKLRLKNIFLDKKIRYDVVDSVIDNNISTVYELSQKAVQLEKWLKLPESTSCLNTFARISNISKDVKKAEVNTELFDQKEEQELFGAYNNATPKIYELISTKQYEQSLDEIAKLRPFIDNYFEKVMVMDNNEDIKQNRLATIATIRDTIEEIADFSKIVQ